VDWRGELASTPFLQSDHPRVQAAAHEAAGDERDPLRAAERLRAWVFRTLEKRPVASIPNAVQVLQMRAGDCNEHAVLFAALARALGLPARVVAGVVYADGAFLYHAWNEVWLGAGWMTVDATFDQMPADATHIKLVEGGPETHAALLTVIGKLAIDPESQPRSES
jgi:transglutaminase-like putative cysteine protease